MSNEERATEETVYITPRRQCYHTDADCFHLDRARTAFEKRRRDVPVDIPICRKCSGEYDPPRSSDSNALRRKLEEMDPDDIAGDL